MQRAVWVLVVLLALLLVSGILRPFVGPQAGGHMYGQGHWGMMGPWSGTGAYGVVGIIVTFLMLALLGAAVIWLLQSIGKSAGAGHSPTPESPLDVLKRRYAAGEITKEQFEEMKRTLGV